MAARGGAGRPRGSSKPMSVEQIVVEAQNYDYNPQISLNRWLHSANALLKEADIYEHEGNDQQTYLYLFRHAQLVLGKLTQHPEVGPSNRAALSRAEADVKAGLAKMEVLKPRINKNYERYERMLRERKAAAASQQPFQAHTGFSAVDPPPRKSSQTSWLDDGHGDRELAAGENRDLAVQLAKKEIRRRAAARKATLRAGIPEEVEQERRTGGVWGDWEKELGRNQPQVDGDSLSRQMQTVRIRVDDRRREAGRIPDASEDHATYSYPSVQRSIPVSSERQSSPPARPLRTPSSSGSVHRGPLPPPKDALSPTLAPPARPPKQPRSYSDTGAPAESAVTTPANDASLKPSEFVFKASAHLENGTALRTVFLPPELRHRFVAIAASNTARNLETCGILCGTLISNALFISRLVIPEQISTSDTCETVNEGALFDYVDSEDLMMLGWIHTHPTQTCFMSSRDLHTHGGYQAMLPESIAIVCAPSKSPDWGIFRLTDPPGLQTVLKCTLPGLFHPHEERNMYTDALRPGHVFEAKGMEWDVQDLRKG